MSINRQTNKMWYIHTKRHQSATQRKEGCWSRLQHGSASPSRHKGQTLYDHFIRYLGQATSQRQKVEWRLPGAAGGGKRESLLNGDRVSIWGTESVLETVVMVAQHCTWSKWHWLVYLKMVKMKIVTYIVLEKNFNWMATSFSYQKLSPGWAMI